MSPRPKAQADFWPHASRLAPGRPRRARNQEQALRRQLNMTIPLTDPFSPFLFNGRYGVQTDPNGLLYMRARYYNPYLCRFINPDPSGFKGGMNFYAYANGNPDSYLDPYGLNATATGDSDNNSLYSPVSNQIPQQPCVVCHEVSASGYNGDPNSFYGLPGSGPDALTGYSDLEDVAVNATPIVLSPLTGNIITITENGTSFILQNAANGQTFESSVLDALGAAKNTTSVTVDGLGTSIPDVIDASGNITEIKSSISLSFNS